MAVANDDEDFMSNNNNGRRTYLVTYSRADLEKFPTRESFGQMVADHFNAGTAKAKVEYFACCLEHHDNGLPHYHVSLKLSGPKKWLRVKQSIHEKEGIVVNFGDKHDDYVMAFRYVCKKDPSPFLSATHEPLQQIKTPTTRRSSSSYRNKQKLKRKSVDPGGTPIVGVSSSASSSRSSTSDNGKQPAKKPARTTNLEVSEFIDKHKISTLTQLYHVANIRKEAGEKDLMNFIFSRTEKQLEEIIEKTYNIKGAAAALERQGKSRFDLLLAKEKEACVDGCDGLWLESANEVLAFNGIHPILFANALRESLIQGRGKWRNIIVCGPANCGKTFILKPLELIYECFTNPAKDKYCWVGAEKKEVILLQDFRWDPETIAWKSLLLLLEGETVKLPAPKNHYAKDVIIEGDVPIFATSKERVTWYGPNNKTCELEDKMMDIRWKRFNFQHQFSEEEKKDIKPCPRCFTKLVLTGHTE